MPQSDIADFLQARLVADLKARLAAHTPGAGPDADEPSRVAALEAQIAALQDAVAEARTMGEEQRQQAETAARRVELLEAQVATLEQAVATAEAMSEQRQQQAETAARQADYLVAELVDITSELVEISKRDDQSHPSITRP